MSGDDDPAVVLSASTADGVWAWVAVEVTAVIDLSKRSESKQLTEQQRLERVLEQQSGYLQRFLSRNGCALSLRFSSDGRGGVDVVLLGRVLAPNPVRAVGAGVELARELAGTPDHVRARAVTDEVRLRTLCARPPIAAGGLMRIQKNVRTAVPSRNDAGVHRYLAVEPFSRTRVSWNPVLERLRGEPAGLTVAVDLQPVGVPDRVKRLLESEATRYRDLGQPLDVPMDLGGRRREQADAAAIEFHPLHQDALTRYGGRCFRFAVTVTGPRAVVDGFVEDVARVMSPPQRADRPDDQNPLGVRTGHIVVRPAPALEGDAVAAYAWMVAPSLPDAALESELARDGRGRGAHREALREWRELVELTEALSIFRLPVAIDGNAPGILVEAPVDEERRLPEVDGLSLLLGHQGRRGAQGSPVTFPLADLPRHGFIVGTPGSGKTNTALNLCRQLWDRPVRERVPFAVIEPVNSELNDYRWLATLRGFEDLVVFTVGDESVAPFRLNPFQVPVGVTVASHVSNLLACFEAAFGLWDPLPFLYRRALTETYRRRNLHPDDRGTIAEVDWPVLADFVPVIAEVTDSLGYEGEVGANIDAAATLRAQSLAEGSCAPVLNCRTSFDIGVLMRRPVVFELAPVSDNVKEQALVTLLIINTMRAWYRHSRRKDDPQHVILLEEAHRVFPRSKPQSTGDAKEGNAQALAAERIAQGLAEDRKYRQSYVLIDQQVGKVAEEAYKITNLKVMHRTAAEEDRKLLGSSMSMTADQTETAATLKPFEAVVAHNGVDRAVTLHVPDVRAADAAERQTAEAPLAEDEELKDRHRRLLSDQRFAEAMAPHLECAPCRSKCRFRQRTQSQVKDVLLAEEIVGCVVDHEGDALPTEEIFARLSEVIDPPARFNSQERQDLVLCAWIHAYRQMNPPELWSATGRGWALEWATHVADGIREPASSDLDG